MEIEQIEAKKAYLDTNIFIYLFEDHPKYQKQISKLIEHLDSIDCQLITSDITLAECLVKPYSDKDTDSVELYKENLQSSDFLQMISVTREILIKASYLRASLRNKMPDSIHVATALLEECDIFIGNDNGIKTPKEIRTIALSNL
ncbi:MAG: putative nucleic acid-binding protein [Gammaproteobacteria bacterium]|jgi:predicted nucleic acid-binding protein